MRLWPKKRTDAQSPNLILSPETTAAKIQSKKKKKTKTGKLRISIQVRKRFEDYIGKKNRKCWNWKGSVTQDGYGQFWLNDRKVVKAHRFLYEISVRQLSKKERLRNVCKDKNCLNPGCWEAFTIGGKRAEEKPVKKITAKKSRRKN